MKCKNINEIVFQLLFVEFLNYYMFFFSFFLRLTLPSFSRAYFYIFHFEYSNLKCEGCFLTRTDLNQTHLASFTSLDPNDKPDNEDVHKNGTSH